MDVGNSLMEAKPNGIFLIFMAKIGASNLGK